MRCPACGAQVFVKPDGAAVAEAPSASGLELDLPAPKVNPTAARKHKGTQVGLGMPVIPAPAAPVAAPAGPAKAAPASTARIAPPVAEDDIDLPTPKNDLPALKSAAQPRIAPPAADAFSAELDDIDLPAPKAPPPAKGKGTQRIAPAFDGPPSTREAPPSSGLDIDLPAPKGVTDLPAAKGHADLPAPKGVTDLPAPKGLADLPAPREFADLPAAKGLGDLPVAKSGSAGIDADLDIDLPAPKPVEGRKFGKAPPPKGGQSLPKDSLAIDPEPLYAGGNLAGPLGHLDDIGPSKGGVDLPAPTNLPAPKKAPPKATAMGLGAKLPKDSLDFPRGAGAFNAQAPEFSIEGDVDNLPAPADLPTPKAQRAVDNALSELDLPAPNDLPARKLPPSTGTAMGIGPTSRDSLDLPPEARGPAAGHGGVQRTAMGIGQMMLDKSLDLPGSPANEVGSFGRGSPGFGGGMEHDFDLPPASGASPGSGLDFGESLDSTFSNSVAKTFGSSGALDVGLDLPPAGGGGQGGDGSLIDLRKLALPSADAISTRGAPFGSTMDLSSDDLELPMGDRNSNVLPLPTSGGGLPLPSMGDIDLFGDAKPVPAAKVTRGQTIELDFDLGGSMAMEPLTQAGAPRGGGAASNTFGELDFGLSADASAVAPLPMPMPQPVPANDGARPGFDAGSVEAELLGGAEPAALPATKKKKKKAQASKAIPAWVWPIVVLLVIAGTGVSLGLFTEHGYFGVYLAETFLPAAGDPVRVQAAIQQAEKQGKTDTYVDVRKSLVTLSDARNEAGLNRELLARSLLHEALYQLRFGEDAQSAQRSVAIMSRVMERGGNVPGLTLARAADAARRNDLGQATILIKSVPKDKDPYRSLVAGEIALLGKKYGEAEKAFAEAEKNGAGARAHWGLARALIGLEKPKEAEAAAAATLALSPRHSAALTYLAEVALASGDMNAAIELTTKANGGVMIDGAPAKPSRNDKTRAWALMGKIEERLEHPKEAQAAYEKALAADPLRVDILIGSGRMLMRLARPRDALARFDSAVSAKPSSKPGPDGRIPLIDAQIGAVQALLAQERLQEAMTRTTALAGQFGDNAEVNLWYGHALVALEKYDDGEAAFKKSIEKAPATFAGYVALSQLLFKRDRPEEAARVLNDATGKVEDSAEVRRMLGNSELNRNHLPEAIHQFEAALRFDARDTGALYGLVIALRKTGKLDEAGQKLAKLEKVDSSFPGLPLERGYLQEMRGDYEGAVGTYRKALEERPTDTDLRLRLGAALVTAGRIEEADAILKQVLKERPTSAEAEHFVGRILFARKETAQAVQRFERAVSFDPIQAEYHMFLAWAHLEQGNLSGALESINKCLERDPNLGDAHWILGRIQLRTGAVKDALENFQRALKLKPGRVEALAQMGDAYDELRELGAAVQAYKDATRAMPENGEWWYKLAHLHLERGSGDEARVALQEAVLRGDRLFEKPRWLADAHRAYADLLREGGRAGEALEHYKLFLSLAPADHPARSEVDTIVRSGTR